MFTMFPKGSKTLGRRERSIQCLLLQPILESPAPWTAAVSQSREKIFCLLSTAPPPPNYGQVTPSGEKSQLRKKIFLLYPPNYGQ